MHTYRKGLGIVLSHKLRRRPISHRFRCCFLIALFLFQPVPGRTAACAAASTASQQTVLQRTGPTIDVWYGDTQVFGRPGYAQKWVNILGTITASDDVAALQYSLNGGATVDLTIGPDGRRLLRKGDFNIDIDRRLLKPGKNVVTIAAATASGKTIERQVTIKNEKKFWPLPYSIDWHEVNRIQDAVQVVDGRWRYDDNGLRPGVMGYDRVVAIGDLDWQSYEITVPITVHAIDSAAYNPISIMPGFGIYVHWTGHTDYPVKSRCDQPHCGWKPVGASVWYDFGENEDGYRMSGDQGQLAGYRTPRLSYGETNLWKFRVETLAGRGLFYRAKVWNSRQAEPDDWRLSACEGTWAKPNGSLLLIAHHVDATFGDLQIVPLLLESNWVKFGAILRYFAQSPVFLVWAIGLLLSVANWHRYPQVTRLTLPAFLLLFLASALGIHSDLHLPRWLHDSGYTTHVIARTLVLVDLARSVVAAVAWGLILWAFWRLRDGR